MRAKLFRTLLLCVWLIIPVLASGQQINWPPANWQPPFPVPEVFAPVGAETCLTRPNPSTLAVISCDLNTLNAFPPFGLVFVRAHEYGHVNQIRFNPGILFSAYAEIDADCFAAQNLALSDPDALRAFIQYEWTVLGMQGDPAHGTGAQRAMRQLQCARAASPTFGINSQPLTERARMVAALVPIAWPQSIQTESHNFPSKFDPLVDGPMADADDKLINEQGAPALRTALDLLIDSSHVAFWEASTKTGIIRPTLQSALSAQCAVSVDRKSLLCMTNKDTLSAVVRELAASEWTKKCTAGCSELTFQHPHDSQDHPVVLVSFNAQNFKILAGVDSHVTHLLATNSAK